MYSYKYYSNAIINYIINCMYGTDDTVIYFNISSFMQFCHRFGIKKIKKILTIELKNRKT